MRDSDGRSVSQSLWDECGSSLVEAALCIFVVVFMLIGVMEGSLALYVEHSLSNLAHDGARYAMVRGSDYSGTTCSSSLTASCDASATDVVNYIDGQLPPGISPSSLTVRTTWPGTTAAGGPCANAQGTNSAGCTVHVTLTYPFTLTVLSSNHALIVLSAHATMTVTQ